MTQFQGKNFISYLMFVYKCYKMLIILHTHGTFIAYTVGGYYCVCMVAMILVRYRTGYGIYTLYTLYIVPVQYMYVQYICTVCF
jgi:hypothetical protein